MMNSSIWKTLFGGQPSSVLDSFTNSSNALSNMRTAQAIAAINQAKAQYAPDMAKQADLQNIAKTQTLQSDAAYEPKLNAATLTAKQLENHQRVLQNMMTSEKFKYLPAQLQAGIALQNAKLEQVKQAIQLAPQKLKLEQDRFGANSSSTAFRNYGHLTKDQKNALGATLASPMAASLTNSFNQITPNAAAAPVIPPMSQNNSTNPNPSMPIQQPTTAQNAQAPGMPNAQETPNISGAPVASPIPTGAQALQLSSEIAANKGAVSAYSTKRLDNSIEIEKMLQNPQMDQWMASLARYSGIAGKGKAFLQKWQKDNPEQFEQYLAAKNNLKSVFINLNRNLEGLSIHVSQRKELTDNLMDSFNSPSSNPERAWDQWQKWKTVMHQIAYSNSIAAQPLFPGVREKLSGLPYGDQTDLTKPVDIKVKGRRATIPLKNLETALQNPDITMDLGD